jgi:aryl-alcohol dehydrogenase-like predicted oxidoreductase
MASMERWQVASSVAISRVGLGGIELGPDDDKPPDTRRAVRVIESAIECGVNWLDTSENYIGTRNESLIGEALTRLPGDFLVASKVAPGVGTTGGGSGFRREQVLKACRDSLKRLRREHLDIYFLHWPDHTGVPLEETWGAMAELADAGLVRAIGLSNYELDDVKRCHQQRRVDAVQVGLSLIDYLDDREYIASCGELGIAVTIYEPIAAGILSNKTMEEILTLWSPWAESGFYKRLLAPGKVERSFAVTDGLRPIADRVQATITQLALAWVLHQPGVAAALAGSSNESHMRENAQATELHLPDGILAEIEQLIPLGPAFA